LAKLFNIDSVVDGEEHCAEQLTAASLCFGSVCEEDLDENLKLKQNTKYNCTNQS